MVDSSSSDVARERGAHERGLDDALRRAFGGVEPLRLEEALFEAILAGWGRQQTSRQLSAATKRSRDGLVRRFGAIRQWIESIIDTLKGQLSLERHGARTMPGLMARICARLLALAAAIRHNQLAGTWDRSLIAYDH